MPNPSQHWPELAHKPKALCGFTLIELIVTASIMALLLAIAVPSFDSVINSSRLTAQANELVASLQLARTEALRRNSRVVVCASNNITAATPACSAGASWTNWIIFVDDGGPDPATRVAADARNGTHENLETVIRVNTVNAPLTVQAAALITNRVGFRSDGLAYDATGALLVSTIRTCLAKKRPPENMRDVNIAAGSRISVSRSGTGTGVCIAP